MSADVDDAPEGTPAQRIVRAVASLTSFLPEDQLRRLAMTLAVLALHPEMTVELADTLETWVAAGGLPDEGSADDT